LFQPTLYLKLIYTPQLHISHMNKSLTYRYLWKQKTG
jgi:hypothetical protein